MTINSITQKLATEVQNNKSAVEQAAQVGAEFGAEAASLTKTQAVEDALTEIELENDSDSANIGELEINISNGDIGALAGVNIASMIGGVANIDKLVINIGTDEAASKEAKMREEIAESRAQQLHSAMEGWGTDNKAVKDILENVKGQDLVDVADAYEKLYGETLEKAIKKDFSFWSGQRKLLNYLKVARQNADTIPREEISKEKMLDEKVKAFNKATINKSGTDERALSQIINGMNTEELQEFIKYYQEKTGKNIEKIIKKETGGALEDLLLNKINNSKTPTDYSKLTLDEKKQIIAEQRADVLFEAMDGFGTEKKVVQDILRNIQGQDLLDVAQAYEKKYGESLEKAIKGDFSFSSQKELLGLLQEAENNEGVSQLNESNIDKVLAKSNAESNAVKFMAATSGKIGADEDKVYELLMSGALSDEEIIAMADELKANDKDIVKIVKNELAYRGVFDFAARMAILGKLQSLGIA